MLLRFGINNPNAIFMPISIMNCSHHGTHCLPRSFWVHPEVLGDFPKGKGGLVAIRFEKVNYVLKIRHV
ncbi:MAG: hypothetical protein NT069_09115, partial [Planctomycetota bacterium]|nr:hypothetical protein [Planctomycetota bacterium]